MARDRQGRDFLRYADVMPLAGLEGEVEEMALYAGQSTGLVHDVRPAADILHELVSVALAQFQRR